jgi:alanine dehydrogenase
MRPDAGGTLLLSRADVRSLLDLDDAIREVERAFALHAAGGLPAPGILGCRADGGGFHVKSAWLPDPDRFAVKANANFPGNPAASGLPTVQGLILLFDGRSGFPLAVMDSMEITILRTAAATAVAAKHCAGESARTVTMWGAGDQARAQVLALARVRPIRRALVYDLVRERAEAVARELECAGLEARAVEDPRAATRESDVVVTCTPSRTPFLGRGDLAPGAFVAAVGADWPEKQELYPELVASSGLIVDVLDQCASGGELHHALVAGLMTRDDVRAELGDVLVGRKPGRTSPDEIVIFDSTGTALQDVAAARLVYERALARGDVGGRISFSL